MLWLGELRVFQSFLTSLHHQVYNTICKLPPPGLCYACFYQELLSISVLALGEDSLSHLCLHLIVSFMFALTPSLLMVSRLWDSVLNPGMVTYSINNGLSFNHVSPRMMIYTIYCEQEIIEDGDH